MLRFKRFALCALLAAFCGAQAMAQAVSQGPNGAGAGDLLSVQPPKDWVMIAWSAELRPGAPELSETLLLAPFDQAADPEHALIVGMSPPFGAVSASDADLAKSLAGEFRARCRRLEIRTDPSPKAPPALLRHRFYCLEPARSIAPALKPVEIEVVQTTLQRQEGRLLRIDRVWRGDEDQFVEWNEDLVQASRAVRIVEERSSREMKWNPNALKAFDRRLAALWGAEGAQVRICALEKRAPCAPFSRKDPKPPTLYGQADQSDVSAWLWVQGRPLGVRPILGEISAGEPSWRTPPEGERLLGLIKAGRAGDGALILLRGGGANAKETAQARVFLAGLARRAFAAGYAPYEAFTVAFIEPDRKDPPS